VTALRVGDFFDWVGLCPAEKTAVNAVAARCLPPHFPVVMAAVQAVIAHPISSDGTRALPEEAEHALDQCIEIVMRR